MAVNDCKKIPILMLAVPMGVVRHIVLHVLGGVSAVWSASECMGWRTEANEGDWRIAVYGVGGLCLLGYVLECQQAIATPNFSQLSIGTTFWQAVDQPIGVIKALCTVSTDTHLQDDIHHSMNFKSPGVWLGFLGFIFGVAQALVLEVVGGAAPIWGCSALWNLRHDDVTVWQILFTSVASVCFVSYALKCFYAPGLGVHLRDCRSLFSVLMCSPHNGLKQVLCPRINSLQYHYPKGVVGKFVLYVCLSLGFCQVLIRDVLGSAGAIWGVGQFFNLHDREEISLSQKIASAECLACIIHFTLSFFYRSKNDKVSKYYPIFSQALIYPHDLVQQWRADSRVQSALTMVAGQAISHYEDDEPLLTV